VKSNKERIMECLTCEYAEICYETVEKPEDYEDGTCKTKRIFEKKEKKEQYAKSS